jgi:hypothetical protein
MIIKKDKNMSFSINSQNNDLLITANVNDNNIIEYQLKISSLNQNEQIILTPGEYEINDVFINSLSSSQEYSKVDMLKLDIEAISMAIVSVNSNLEKKAFVEKLGLINILIVQVNKFISSEAISNIINELEPLITIVDILIDDDNLYGNIIKEIGIEPDNIMSRLKITRQSVDKLNDNSVVYLLK